jgi:hypothetical protein
VSGAPIPPASSPLYEVADAIDAFLHCDEQRRMEGVDQRALAAYRIACARRLVDGVRRAIAAPNGEKRDGGQ